MENCIVKSVDKPLAYNRGKIRMVDKTYKILGKSRLHAFGFDLSKGNVTHQQAVSLNKAKEEMPSTSDVANTDDIGLQEITENVARSTENFIAQLEDKPSEDLRMRELLGLDKQLRSIRSSLKVEMATKFQLEECKEQEKCKLEEIRNIPDYTDVQLEEIKKHITRLNEELSVRQEGIVLF